MKTMKQQQSQLQSSALRQIDVAITRRMRGSSVPPVTFSFLYCCVSDADHLQLSADFYRRYRKALSLPSDMQFPHYEIVLHRPALDLSSWMLSRFDDAYVFEALPLWSHISNRSCKDYLPYVGDIHSMQDITNVVLMWSLGVYITLYIDPDRFAEFTTMQALHNAQGFLEKNQAYVAQHALEPEVTFKMHPSWSSISERIKCMSSLMCTFFLVFLCVLDSIIWFYFVW